MFCIDCLISYVDWINIELIFSKDFLLITVVLELLRHKELCVEAAKCLISILSRKGSVLERKPMINILNEHLLGKIYECFMMVVANRQFEGLFKYLVIGVILNSKWVFINLSSIETIVWTSHWSNQMATLKKIFWSFESLSE